MKSIDGAIVLAAVAGFLLVAPPAELRAQPPTTQAAEDAPSAAIGDLADSKASASSRRVFVGQSQLFKFGRMEIRQVTCSNEAVARALLPSGSVRIFSVIGLADGLTDITVWPRDPKEDPVQVRIRVVPDPSLYAPLVRKIHEALGVDVQIEPIAESNKIRVAGRVADYWQAVRVLNYISGDAIRPDRIVSELWWPCYEPPPPPCVPVPHRHWCKLFCGVCRRAN